MSRPSKLQQETKQSRPFRSPRQEAAMGLLRTADVVRRYYDELYAPHGITSQQYNVLRILRGARPHALPTMEIAERMIERTPGITRLLDRLEAKKLARRERSADDRRQVMCSITPAGLKLLGALDELVDAADTAALEVLDAAEIERLIAMLDRVRQRHR